MRKMKKTKELKEYIKIIIELIIIFITFFTLCWPIKIQGISMENTLNNNDIVLVSRISKYLNNIQKGDLIIFKEKINNKKTKIVKRVIATEGDTIEIINGNVYINSKLIAEYYKKGNTSNYPKTKIKENCFFVMGDNREHSKDSRNFNEINKKNIIGKIFIKLYPLNKIEFYK